MNASRLAADVDAVLARGLAAVPPRVALALSGRRERVVDGQVLDPGIALLLRVLALRGSGSFIAADASDVEAARARVRAESRSASRWPTPVAEVRELRVDGGAGPLGARLYRAPVPEAPLLVFFHGGGWVVGDLDTHDEPCRMLCRHGSVHVLSVDYRLAPEHPFPAAVEDALAATRWAIRNAEAIGARPDSVAVGGDSAGGNLAAVTAQELRGEGLALQVLIYPGLDLATTATRSGELFAHGFYLDDASREWCMERYVPAGADRTDPRLSPLRAAELGGVAPAVVVTAAFDPLRDEGEAYAEALRQTGVHTVALRADGLIHGFINLTQVNRRAREAMLVAIGMVRAELHPR